MPIPGRRIPDAARPLRSHTPINTERVYDGPDPDDGLRVLVDRLWPRAPSKDDAAIDRRPRELAPSTELRTWVHAGDGDFNEFRKRDTAELQSAPPAGMKQALETVLEPARAGRTLTLRDGARDTEQNHATILRDWLAKTP